MILVAAAPFLQSASADTKKYRDYLTSIEGFELWFRIGSYSLTVEGMKTPVDLFYRDSDLRPDGKEVRMRVYPNVFDLFCVWRSPDGNWHCKEVGGVGRATFHQIVAVEDDRIELELRPKFQITLGPDDDLSEHFKRADEINKPYPRILFFKGGEPFTRAPKEPKKAEPQR